MDGRRRRGDGRLWGGLGGDVWNSGGRHVACVSLFAVFLFDKVVTAGKLFFMTVQGVIEVSGLREQRSKRYAHRR